MGFNSVFKGLIVTMCKVGVIQHTVPRPLASVQQKLGTNYWWTGRQRAQIVAQKSFYTSEWPVVAGLLLQIEYSQQPLSTAGKVRASIHSMASRTQWLVRELAHIGCQWHIVTENGLGTASQLVR